MIFMYTFFQLIIALWMNINEKLWKLSKLLENL
uniref:THO complex 2 n=1 Tax=Molossus molossus TaxID=27622 RepID=A0A7J8J9P2_MOLMO|nr:THO complex 2 [Molossus molossus]